MNFHTRTCSTATKAHNIKIHIFRTFLSFSHTGDDEDDDDVISLQLSYLLMCHHCRRWYFTFFNSFFISLFLSPPSIRQLEKARREEKEEIELMKNGEKYLFIFMMNANVLKSEWALKVEQEQTVALSSILIFNLKCVFLRFILFETCSSLQLNDW